MSVQPSRRAQRAAPSSALLDRLILKAKLASDEAFRAIESESQGTASRRGMLLLPFLHHVLSVENLCGSHLRLDLFEVIFAVGQSEPCFAATVLPLRFGNPHVLGEAGTKKFGKIFGARIIFLRTSRTGRRLFAAGTIGVPRPVPYLRPLGEAAYVTGTAA